MPVFRYGYSYLILLISLIFGMISIKFNIIKKRQLFLQITILILMFVFVTKNLNRIIASDKYYNYPWPKIYSMNENNISKKTKYKVINKKKIYYAEDGYCMYDTSPCGPLDGKLMINKTKGYLFFYK